MALNFPDKKKKRNVKADSNADFLLPEDKKKIKKLSEEKYQHLKTIEELNHRILIVQNSTGTLFPKFVRLHHHLRQKYRWYYNWHTKGYAPTIHWLVLILYLVSLPLVYSYLTPKVEVTSAVAATKLVVEPATATVKAGKCLDFTIRAVNDNNITDSSKNSYFSLANTDSKSQVRTSDCKAPLTSEPQLASGNKTVYIYFEMLGSQTITATHLPGPPTSSPTTPTPTPTPIDPPTSSPTPTPTPPPIPMPPGITDQIPAPFELENASAAGLDSGSATITVTPGDPARMTFANFPGEVSQDSPSSAITINLFDPFSNQTTTGTNQNINLSTSSAGGKFSQSSGGPWTTGSLDITLPAGSGSVNFYYLDTSPGSSTIIAAETPSAGWNDAQGTLTVNQTVEPTPTPTPTPTPIPTESISATPLFLPSPSLAPTPLTITSLLEHPVANTISKALTPIGTAVATIGILPLLVQAFPQAFHGFASLFPALFTAFSVHRRRKPWGMVFDSLTGRPIEGALIRIFEADTGRLFATKVTDQNGSFNFLLAKGKYYLRVAKEGYLFPPKISKLKANQLSTRFGPDSDLYLGQPFFVKTDGTNINLSIALDPIISRLLPNVRTKMWFKNAFDWFQIALSYVAIPMMLAGAFITALATLIIPSRFNFYLGVVYIILLGAYLISHRIQKARFGFVFDSQTLKPIANALVSIIDKEYNAIREVRSTDKEGHFAILAQKGEYYFTVEAENFTFPAKDFKIPRGGKFDHLYFGGLISHKKTAFINVDIPMQQKM